MHCLADVSFTPIGPSEVSIEKAIDSCNKLLQDSGLTYVVHDGGFTIEAEWVEATSMIGKLHEHLHSTGFTRVHSNLRVGTRTDKAQTMQDKIDTVENKLKNGSD